MERELGEFSMLLFRSASSLFGSQTIFIGYCHSLADFRAERALYMLAIS